MPTNGYKDLLDAIRGELNIAIEPLQTTVNETRDDVKALRKETYTREMMDEKLKNLTDRLDTQENDLKGIHRLIGNSWKELLERVAAVAGIAYSLVYVIPHLFH